MSDPAPSLKRNRLLGYWWAPLMLLAVALAVTAYLQPYQALSLSDLSPQVVQNAALLDKSFGKPVSQAYKYSTQRTYSSVSGPIDVEIRVRLVPMGNGLVMREDDWYDIKGRNVVYQERLILFRNLFAVHTRNREVAPLAHDLMGRVGWFNDSAESLASSQNGSPEDPNWKMDVTTDRSSDTDGKSLTLQTTRYQRRLHCERSGEMDGAAIGAAFKNRYPRISCKSSASNQTSDRQSDYVWLPEHGLFLLLGFQQQAESTLNPGSTDRLDVKGSYLSFDAQSLGD